MRSSATDRTAAICAAIFIVVLAVSAYFDESIRVLHVVEALPYLVAAILVLKQNKVGYALGFAGGGFWLLMSSWRTTFVGNGFHELAVWLRTGQLHRPDQFIAVPAAISTGGLALFCVIGYARLRDKRALDVALFAGAIVFMAIFFYAIFAAFQPRYLALFRGIV